MTQAEATIHSVIRPRWQALAKRVMPHRLTRVIAPSGFHKTLFSNFLLETIPATTTHRLDFADYRTLISVSLPGVIKGIVDALGLDPYRHSTPHLLARTPVPKPRQFADALREDFASPDLDQHVLILEGLQDLDTSIISVLLNACRANPMRVRLIVCLRTEQEFPLNGMIGVPVLDITAEDLALTQNELSSLRVQDPSLRGWPHGVYVTLQGGSVQQELRDMVRLLEPDLRRELYTASVLDVWPPSPEIAAALQLRPGFLDMVRREGLVLTRAAGTYGQAASYELLPALRVIVQEEAEREFPGLLNTSRQQLAQILNIQDPVRSVRLLSATGAHDQIIQLVNDAIRAGDVTLLEHVQEDLIKVSLHLHKRARLHLALLLARSGKTEEALRILRRLLPEVEVASKEREKQRKLIAPGEVLRGEVHLALGRVLMLTGAASAALVELKKAAITSDDDPMVQGYTALVICMLHARGVREQLTGSHPLQEAESYVSYITHLTLHEELPEAQDRQDVALMGLACEMYFAFYHCRPLGPLLSRLSFVLAEGKFREIETGLAILFAARILMDVEHQDIAEHCLQVAQPLIAGSRDGQVLLPFLRGRQALRLGRAGLALGHFEEAVSAASHPAVDQEIRAEALEARLCAALCCPDMDLPTLQEMNNALIPVATRAEHRTVVKTGLSLAVEYEERCRGVSTARSVHTISRRISDLLADERMRRSEVYVFLLLRMISIRGRPEERARHVDLRDARLHFGDRLVDGYQSLLIPHLQGSVVRNVSVTTLGEIRVEIDGTVVPFRGAHLQIFMYIALAGAQGVSRAQLIQDLYDGDQPRGHKALMRFRDFLEANQVNAELCAMAGSRAMHYTLAHNRVEVDVLQLQQLLNEKPSQASYRFRQAGQFLPGVETPWINRWRKDLHTRFASK